MFPFTYALKKTPNIPALTRFWVTMLSKKGVCLSAEIAGKAIPQIPSNLAAMKETPGSCVASPMHCFVIVALPI